MPRTILMVTNNYTPYSGGVVSSVQVTADVLRQEGNRVIIVTLDFTGGGSQEPDLIRISCPIRFMYRHNHMALPWRPEVALQHIMDVYQPHIVHVHHPFLLGPVAQRVAHQKNIPVVFTYHTLYEHYAHYVPLPQCITKPIMLKLVQNFCKRVNAVVVPSKSLQSHIAVQGFQAAHVASTGILPQFVVQQKPVAKKCQGIIELLTVSRFTKEKNIRFLLDVMQRLGSGYRLTLIGYGAQQEELEQYAYETLQLSRDHVQFIVKPTKEQIARWYQEAHLFIFASRSETQGLVLAESMAAGTPIVALRGPGVVDIIENGINGYVVDSEQEMASRITELIQEQVIYQKLQHGAYETAKNYYPGRTIQKLIAVYDTVMKQV